jgi:hypothetical protein
VRERADQGVDVVKVTASGGTMTPGTRQEESQFTADLLRAAVDEASVAVGITAGVSPAAGTTPPPEVVSRMPTSSP